VLRIPNVRSGRVDATDLKFATVDEAELGDCFVRQGDRLDPTFAAMALSSPELPAEIESRAASSAGQYNLNIQSLKALRLPLPSLAEQRRLVADFVARRDETESAVAELRAVRELASLKGANNRVAAPLSEGWEDQRHGLLFSLPCCSGSAWRACS
jgi:hypothetical protein